MEWMGVYRCIVTTQILASFPGRLPLRVAYVTFELLSDKRQKAWYHSYVIYKQGGHGYEATRLHVYSSSYIATMKTAT